MLNFFWDKYIFSNINLDIFMKKELVVIDLGTSTVCATIAKYIGGKNKKIKILGLGYRATKGLDYSRVISLSDVENSILDAITIASDLAQKRVKSVIVSLPPWAVNSQIVEISRDIDNTPIDNSVIRSMANECSVNNETIIHIIPVNYFLDDVSEIKNPIGMTCKKLSAIFNILSVQKNLLNSLKNCFTKNNIEVSAFVSSAFMSAIAVTQQNNSCITVLDIGSSCTSISCINDGVMVYSEHIPVGSNSITRDIAFVLKISEIEAERLKTVYGLSNDISQDQVLITTKNQYDEQNIQSVPSETLSAIITARIDDIFDIIKKHILDNGVTEEYYENIFITGGGSRLTGLNEYINLKSFIAGSSLSVKCPKDFSEERDYSGTASFSASAGMLLYGFKLIPDIDIVSYTVKDADKISLFDKLKSLFKGKL